MSTLLATHCSLHFDKRQKNSVHCLYLHSFQSNTDEKSCKRAKIEAIKQLLAVLLLIAELRRHPIRL